MPTLSLEDFVAFLPTLLKGAKLTILLTFAVFVLATSLGLLVALGRMSRFRFIRVPLTAYVELIRCTPGLVQIYYIFYVMPFAGLTLAAIPAGIAGLTLNYAAYMSEVFRSGIQAIPVTQREAATTIGLSYFQAMRFVVLPQAIRTVLPAIVNYLLMLFKDTSLLSVITIQELLFSGLLLAAATFKYHIILTEIALIYFIICYPVSLLATYLEHRLKQRRGSPRGTWSLALRRALPSLTKV
jgi:polar amino acid transport system permease protein